jgi:hypothetical protein
MWLTLRQASQETSKKQVERFSCWFLVWLIFNHGDEGDMFLQNVEIQCVVSKTIELFAATTAGTSNPAYRYLSNPSFVTLNPLAN